MRFEIAFTPEAEKDWEYWSATDPKTAEKIRRMLRELSEHPFIGTGKPEPLRHQFSGCWSRRINHTDRLVYHVNGKIVTIFVLSMRYHYDV